MSYVSIEVDVDLDDVITEMDDDDILNEFIRRIKRYEERELSEVRAKLGVINYITNKSLDDTMKIEFLQEIWGNITSFELEELLKHKK